MEGNSNEEDILRGRGALLFVGAATLAMAISVTDHQVVSAQVPAPPSPWAAAPVDFTGYWVSIVNEDWRWRMVTPPKGDVQSVPINNDGRALADKWDRATDGSCLAYGAAAVMRIPTRLHITWEGDNVLKIETDAGVQTRRLSSAPARPARVRCRVTPWPCGSAQAAEPLVAAVLVAACG